MTMWSSIRRPLVGGAIAILAAAMLAACGGGSSNESSATGGSGASEESGGTVKIGVVVPLTGPLAFYGPLFRDAIELRLEEAGAEAGGKHVEVIFKDGSGELSTAQAHVKELVERDGVSMIIGPLNAAFMAGLAPYFSQHQIPTIALLNLPLELGKTGWIFTPQSSLSGMAAPMGWYAYEHMGVRTATVQGADYIAGHQIIGGFASAFEQKGGKVVQEEWAPLGTSEFGSYLSNLQPADAQVSWYPGTQQNFMSQYFQHGKYKQTMLGYGDTLTEDVLDKLGPEMIGTKAPLTYTWLVKNAANEKFVKAYQEKYHRPPITEIDEGAYEAASVALEALNATEGATDPEGIRKAILAEQLETPAGPLRFDPTTGMGIRNVYILSVEREKGKLVWKPISTYKNVKPTAGEPK